MSENILGSHSGSHHGAPDLFERDIKLLLDYQKWVNTVRATGLTRYTNWTPGYVDILKSRLFWRIRSGKDPLPEAPPCAYSCPWYEVIEVPGPHDVWEEIRTYGPGNGYETETAYVAQERYQVLEKNGSTLTLKYNCYKFKSWNGMIPTSTIVTDAVSGEKKIIDTESPGGWIQYIGNV